MAHGALQVALLLVLACGRLSDAQNVSYIIVHSAGVMWSPDSVASADFTHIDEIGVQGANIFGSGSYRVFRSHCAPNAGVLLRRSGGYPSMVIMLDTSVAADTAHFGLYVYTELMWLTSAGWLAMTPQKCAQIRDEYPAVGGGGYYYIMHLPNPADTGLTALDGGGTFDSLLFSPPAQLLVLPSGVARSSVSRWPGLANWARAWEGSYDLAGRCVARGTGSAAILRVTPDGHERVR